MYLCELQRKMCMFFLHTLFYCVARRNLQTVVQIGVYGEEQRQTSIITVHFCLP